VEVAHDIQIPVSRYITGSLALINSFDTWHGVLLHIPHAPNFQPFTLLQERRMWTSKMWKITEGRVKDRGVSWFPELVDKSESTSLSVTIVPHKLFSQGRVSRCTCTGQCETVEALRNSCVTSLRMSLSTTWYTVDIHVNCWCDSGAFVCRATTLHVPQLHLPFLQLLPQ
jgi:hypothetical protein